MGEVGGLSAPRAARSGRARLYRPGARLRLGRHRQDDRRAAPRGGSGAPESGRARAADHVLEDPRERAQGAAAAPGRERAETRRADRRASGDRDRLRALHDDFRDAEPRAAGADRDAVAPRPRRRPKGTRFTPQFLLGEWEDVVDAWQIETLGGLSRCRPPRPQDPLGGAATRDRCGRSSSGCATACASEG